MLKKIILLCFGIFLLTGCDATYNLEINGYEYHEDVSIIETNSAYFYSGDYPANSLLEYGLTYPFALDADFVTYSESTEKIDGVDYYEVEDISGDNSVGIRFDGTFDYDSFENSNMIVSNYNRFIQATIDGNVVLSTGERLKAFDQYTNLDTVTINITTNNEVISHNADSVDGDTYTWVVTRSNYTDKSVYFEFLVVEEEEEETSDLSDSIILVVLLVIVIIICITALVILIKNKKNNRL